MRPSHTHDACRPWGISDLVIQVTGLTGGQKGSGLARPDRAGSPPIKARMLRQTVSFHFIFAPRGNSLLSPVTKSTTWGWDRTSSQTVCRPHFSVLGSLIVSVLPVKS